MSSSSQQSDVPGPAAAAGSRDWAPHGAVLTACLVGMNVLMVLLVFFFFWRFFSGKRGQSSASVGGGDEEEAASSSAGSSPAASPGASRRHRQQDLASSLPVSVYDDGADDGKVVEAADCAVCIVEFRGGDLARLLPRCGHRFHAACVDAWLQLHATCPLCRAAVAPPAASAGPKNDPKDGGTRRQPSAPPPA